MQAPAANQRIAFEVAFEDTRLLVVVKHKGLVTRPGRGHERDTLVNGVMAHYGAVLSRLGADRDFGLLHRLDRASSGLVAFALTAESYDALRQAFASRNIAKTYLAWTRSPPPKRRQTIRIRLLEVRLEDRKLSVPDLRGEEAVTHIETLALGTDGTALVRCSIETGRLHQIRAHLAWLGCPLEGDQVYARPGLAPDGRASAARHADRTLLLHAWRLDLPHPARRDRLEVEAPLPEAWQHRAHRAGINLAQVLGSGAGLAKRVATDTINPGRAKGPVSRSSSKSYGDRPR